MASHLGVGIVGDDGLRVLSILQCCFSAIALQGGRRAGAMERRGDAGDVMYVAAERPRRQRGWIGGQP